MPRDSQKESDKVQGKGNCKNQYMWICAFNITSFVCIHRLLRFRKIRVYLLFFPLGRHKNLVFLYSQNILTCSNGYLITSKPVNTSLSLIEISLPDISLQILNQKIESKYVSSSMGKLSLLSQLQCYQYARKRATHGH